MDALQRSYMKNTPTLTASSKAIWLFCIACILDERYHARIWHLRQKPAYIRHLSANI